MIKINLLGEKEDIEASYVLQVLGFVTIVVLMVGIGIFVQGSVSSRLDVVNEEKAKLELDLTKLKKITKEVEDLEKNRRILKEKLTTIALLKARKQGPVKVLDDLNVAIPERAWVTAAKEKNGQLEVSGVVLDNVTLAQFMAALGQKRSFGNVSLVHSTQVEKEKVKLKEFLLTVELKNPLDEISKAKLEGRPSDLEGASDAKKNAKKQAKGA